MHALEQQGAVQFVGVFEGEITAGGRWPTVGWSIQQYLVEVTATLLLVGVIAAPI